MTSPALQLAPNEYTADYQNQLNRVLTLYFSRNEAQIKAYADGFNSSVAYATVDLPAATTAYQRAFVSDATATTFYSIVAGGGANIVPVFSDGINWRIG